MSICNRCGTQFNSPYCPNCGGPAQTQGQNPPPLSPNIPYRQNSFTQQPTNQFKQNMGGIICPRCGGNHVIISSEQNLQVKNRGCFSWVIWILLAICTCGIILIIPLVTNTKVNSNSRRVFICQNCGNRWYS